MNADFNDDDDSDLQYEDQEELERRERMNRTQGPSYYHFTLRQQHLMQNHCLGRDLSMGTCQHFGAEKLPHLIICSVCEIGEISKEEDYKRPVAYRYCEKCTLKGYLG